MAHFSFDITTDNFSQEVSDSALPVLVDFGADWCPPCRMLEPIVDALAQKYQGKMRVGKVDADAHPQLQEQFGVMGLPTLILFVDGKPTQRIVGFTSGERIEAKLLPYLQQENA